MGVRGVAARTAVLDREQAQVTAPARPGNAVVAVQAVDDIGGRKLTTRLTEVQQRPGRRRCAVLSWSARLRAAATEEVSFPRVVRGRLAGPTGR
jgi:hypothetical protein